jgi:hypothetical protein
MDFSAAFVAISSKPPLVCYVNRSAIGDRPTAFLMPLRSREAAYQGVARCALMGIALLHPFTFLSSVSFRSNGASHCFSLL